MTDTCAHDFLPMADIPGASERVFICERCGLEVAVGGTLVPVRTAKDDSYRPDIPLRSTEANVAAWADSIARKATEDTVR